MRKIGKYSVPVAARPDFRAGAWREGVTLYDTEGKAYTDWVAGIAVNALGYGDPGINGRLSAKQMDSGLIHVSGLVPHASAGGIGRIAVQPMSFADKVYFCNSGAEANEGALKFAQKTGLQQGIDAQDQSRQL